MTNEQLNSLTRTLEKVFTDRFIKLEKDLHHRLEIAVKREVEKTVFSLTGQEIRRQIKEQVQTAIVDVTVRVL